jgi:hypothetical protein
MSFKSRSGDSPTAYSGSAARSASSFSSIDNDNDETISIAAFRLHVALRLDCKLLHPLMALSNVPLRVRRPAAIASDKGASLWEFRIPRSLRESLAQVISHDECELRMVRTYAMRYHCADQGLDKTSIQLIRSPVKLLSCRP